MAQQKIPEDILLNMVEEGYRCPLFSKFFEEIGQAEEEVQKNAGIIHRKLHDIKANGGMYGNGEVQSFKTLVNNQTERLKDLIEKIEKVPDEAKDSEYYKHLEEYKKVLTFTQDLIGSKLRHLISGRIYW